MGCSGSCYFGFSILSLSICPGEGTWGDCDCHYSSNDYRLHYRLGHFPIFYFPIRKLPLFCLWKAGKAAAIWVCMVRLYHFSHCGGAVLRNCINTVAWSNSKIMLTFLLFIAGIAIIFVGASLLVTSKSEVRRYQNLIARFGDQEVAYRIMNSMYWQGQTAEQLEESLGRPVAIDKSVKRNGTKDIWKYFQTSKSRFSLRITLENDKVTGWDDKAT